MIDQSVIENYIDNKNIRWLKLDDNFKNEFFGNKAWKISMENLFVRYFNLGFDRNFSW